MQITQLIDDIGIDLELAATIAEGLQLLLAINFPSTPARKDLDIVLHAWCIAIHSSGKCGYPNDNSRLKKAFAAATYSCDRWPVPANILELLPRREDKIKAIEYKRPIADPNDPIVIAAREKMDKLFRNMRLK